MCGVYVSIGFKPDSARIDIVSHRGPDGRGWQVRASKAGPVALGHRRLAIIDTTDAGLQPMRSPSGRYWMVFNGECYNYVELRDELTQLGEKFTTSSDTEVLLRSLERWGKDALAKLRGMFAFVLWDDAQQRLLAVRDRFGIKPLYFAQSPQGFVMGSEIKQLIGLPGLEPRMNIARVHDYLASGIQDHTSETMFAGVRQLRPGEYLEIDASRATLGGPTIGRWYSQEFNPIEIDRADAARRFRELLTESVNLHLRSDVSVGSCLSGGLDSSSIVCLMSKSMGRGVAADRLHTISACYTDKSVDERPFIDAVVDHAGTRPHFVYPKAEDLLARASDVTWHQDEPFGSSSIFAQWCVFESARAAGIKVMLDGQGADELLAGYHSAFSLYEASLVRRFKLLSLASTLMARQRTPGVRLSREISHLAFQLLPEPLKRMARRQLVPAERHGWLDGSLINERGNPLGALAVASRNAGVAPITDLASYCISMTFGANLQMLLHWEDRNSMAHGIEARVPFLDHPLVEFALALGNDHKIVAAETKHVLREAMRGVLPEKIRDRRDKLGFATPEASWFRGQLSGMVIDGVEATLRLYPGLFNASAVRAITGAMLDGRMSIDFSLWRIVNLGLWGERFDVSVE